MLRARLCALPHGRAFSTSLRQAARVRSGNAKSIAKGPDLEKLRKRFLDDASTNFNEAASGTREKQSQVDDGSEKAADKEAVVKEEAATGGVANEPGKHQSVQSTEESPSDTPSSERKSRKQRKRSEKESKLNNATARHPKMKESGQSAAGIGLKDEELVKIASMVASLIENKTAAGAISVASDTAQATKSKNKKTTKAKVDASESEQSLVMQDAMARFKELFAAHNSLTKQSQINNPEQAQKSKVSSKLPREKGNSGAKDVSLNRAESQKDPNSTNKVSARMVASKSGKNDISQAAALLKSIKAGKMSPESTIEAVKKLRAQLLSPKKPTKTKSELNSDKTTAAAGTKTAESDGPQIKRVKNHLVRRVAGDFASEFPALQPQGTIKEWMQAPSQPKLPVSSEFMKTMENKADTATRIGPIKATKAQEKAGFQIETLSADDLTLTPVEVAQKPVPTLAYGLEKVLFNPGVYQLQDPRSRVYNFDPYLQKIMPNYDFDFSALRPYATSSKDESLLELQREHKRKYTGSTSSMSAVLAHFHFLLSQWRGINPSLLSRSFPVHYFTYTALQRGPSSIFLRYRDGAYAIDADKEFDTPNILSMLGKSMEKMLTLPKEDFEKYRKQNSHQLTEEERNEADTFHYTTMGDFLLRSQLDAFDARLPGTGMFDLKTRAVVSIRMDVTDFEQGLGYEIKERFGEHESYELEYYDMIRAAFLKYSLQVRMGRMDGIFVAFHNTERIFGFQYISISEMDLALHGTQDTSLGDDEFKMSLDLLNKVLDKATKKFPEKSLRMHFETRGQGSATPFMYMFAEPMEEEQIDAIQNTGAAATRAFEQKYLGLHQEELAEEEKGTVEERKQAEWERLRAKVEETIRKDEMNIREMREIAEMALEESEHWDELSPDEKEKCIDSLLKSPGLNEQEGVDGVTESDLIDNADEEDSLEEEDGEEVTTDEVEEYDHEDVARSENVDLVDEALGSEDELVSEEAASEDVADEGSMEEESLSDDASLAAETIPQDMPGNEEDFTFADEISEATAEEEDSTLDKVPISNEAGTGNDTSIVKDKSTVETEEQILQDSAAEEPEFKESSDNEPTQEVESPSLEELNSDSITHESGTLSPSTSLSEPSLDSTPDSDSTPPVSSDTASSDLLALTLTIRNKVDGQYVERPTGKAYENWSIEYAIAEIAPERSALLYAACKTRRETTLSAEKRAEDIRTGNNGYLNKLRMLSRKGRRWRALVDERESGMEKKVLWDNKGVMTDLNKTDSAAGVTAEDAGDRVE